MQSHTHANPAPDAYRFDHFSLKVMAGDLRFSRDALRPGDRVPNLPVIDGNGQLVKIHDMCRDQPLLLMTGSITCPMTISALPPLRQVHERLQGKVKFALLYVREAHPAEHYPQTKTLEEKQRNARDLRDIYGVDWPVVIDDLDGSMHHALDVMPNSAHILGRDGVILYRSLWAGDMQALERALEQVAQDQPVKSMASQRMLVPFLRGAGYMHGTLKLAGGRSYRELALGAPPIALLARTAALFTFVPPDRRGMAAALGLTAVLIGGLILAIG